MGPNRTHSDLTRAFCGLQHNPESLCNSACMECIELAQVAVAYGEQCRRAGAEAMREAAAEIVQNSATFGIGGAAIMAIPIPPAAEAASPAAGWRVPDGWKLVPTAATDDMARAWMRDAIDGSFAFRYRALLAACPSPPPAPSEEARAG